MTASKNWSSRTRTDCFLPHRTSCQQFLTLLAGFPNTKSNLLGRLKAEVQAFRQTSRQSNWMNLAKPVPTAAVELRKRSVVPSRQRLAYALPGLVLLIVPLFYPFNYSIQFLNVQNTSAFAFRQRESQ
ncbi:hypothetical protein BV898_18247 [Hypsibius exemplaris]|uniref:Uncharacterized protein n=1 Tax=Hypsibius exemplaris TaxID=2072580 RepID=A0A9X6RNA2_HYPEX|nr:hypothetical protein BV898_18247 [Hypsibius exemplaris]